MGSCNNLTRKNKCKREGGCVWLRGGALTSGSSSRGICVSEQGVACSLFSRTKCNDQKARCTWGKNLGLGRTCLDSAALDCSSLSKQRCKKADGVCSWTNAQQCVHV